MRREDDIVLLEKHDFIRMNQLVRERIDLGGFINWYVTLDSDQQAWLIGELCHCAYQAGVDDEVIRRAHEESLIDVNDHLIETLKKVRGPGGLNYGGLAKWLAKSDSTIRQRALKWFAYLFGIAERQRIEQEDRTTCNHWWHRNLSDSRVVEDLMNDPQFYKTSPRDDEQFR
jgi:hypothetical protein